MTCQLVEWNEIWIFCQLLLLVLFIYYFFQTSNITVLIYYFMNFIISYLSTFSYIFLTIIDFRDNFDKISYFLKASNVSFFVLFFTNVRLLKISVKLFLCIYFWQLFLKWSQESAILIQVFLCISRYFVFLYKYNSLN